MTTKQALSVKIDFLNIVFDTIRAEDLFQIFQIPLKYVGVSEGRMRHKDYQKLYQFGQIKIYGDAPYTRDNPNGLGCYLALGGKGCDELQDFIGKESEAYGRFFQKLEEQLEKDSFRITRLDLAIDDRNEKPFFTVEQLKRKCDKGEFLSKSRKQRFQESGEAGDMAKTLYIGDTKSDLSIRFYDKDKQISHTQGIPLEMIGTWKRTELQLRNGKAHLFAIQLKDNNLGLYTFGLLKESLRFVVPDFQQKNKSRWETCRFWERFLGQVEGLKICPEKEENFLSDTQEWLKYGGALSAVKAFEFLETHGALGNLKNVQDLKSGVSYSSELVHKMVSHLQEIKREELIPLVHEDTRRLMKLVD